MGSDNEVYYNGAVVMAVQSLVRAEVDADYRAVLRNVGRKDTLRVVRSIHDWGKRLWRGV